jgi:pimeloyl-ACP methyl ester carboxylesterase
VDRACWRADRCLRAWADYAWQGLAQGLTTLGYRGLVYDLYGRGYSDRPTGIQSREFFLRQLDDLLADQDVEDDITLLGYSMVGAIASLWAAAHPERIRQLLLFTPAGMGANTNAFTRFIVGTPVIGDWLMLALFPRQLRKRNEAERALPSSVDRIVDRQQEELRFRGYIPGVLSSIRGLLAGDLEDEHRALHRADVPMLAFWGREDDLIPLTARSS